MDTKSSRTQKGWFPPDTRGLSTEHLTVSWGREAEEGRKGYRKSAFGAILH